MLGACATTNRSSRPWFTCLIKFSLCSSGLSHWSSRSLLRTDPIQSKYLKHWIQSIQIRSTPVQSKIPSNPITSLTTRASLFSTRFVSSAQRKGTRVLVEGCHGHDNQQTADKVIADKCRRICVILKLRRGEIACARYLNICAKAHCDSTSHVQSVYVTAVAAITSPPPKARSIWEAPD